MEALKSQPGSLAVELMEARVAYVQSRADRWGPSRGVKRKRAEVMTHGK
jgi:hypothetical protein